MDIIRANTGVSGDRNWKFTALDLACFGMIIKGQWIFAKIPNIEQMKSSLAEVLDYYPHLAGRVKDNNCIEMNNEGVVFEVVDNFVYSLADVTKMRKSLDKFNAGINLKNFKKGLAAPLSIRLTKLFDGAILSVHCAHVCMDGTGFYSFVDNWSRIARGESITTPTLDQSVIPVGGELTKETVSQLQVKHGWKPVGFGSLIGFVFQNAAGITSTVTEPIHISDEQINTLKDKIAESGIKCGTHASLSALILKLIIEMNGFKKPVKCTNSSVVDFRGRVANVSATYTGNAVINIETAEFSSDVSIAELARVVNESLQKIHTSELEEIVKLSINAMFYKLPMAPFDLKAMNASRPSVFNINNQRKFPVYDVDFGQGKPLLALPNDLPDQVKFWPSTPDSPGVEIYLGSQVAVKYNNCRNRDQLLADLLS